MKKQDLFKNKNIGLLCPYSFEFLNHLIGQLGYIQEQYDSIEVKQDVLSVLRHLLDLEIIEVFNWMNNSHMNNLNMTSQEILKQIDTLWFEGIEYPDFYGIVLFGSTEWYVKKLESLGMTHTTNWETFVQDNLGDLEQWIEKNKPKANESKTE